MYLHLTDEQRLLGDAAASALARYDTLAGARSALDQGPAPDLWPTAVRAGWAGLLSAHDADGAALGAFEASLVLEACGRCVADAHLLGHLPATAVLEDGHAPVEVRAEVAAGARTALVSADLAYGDASLRLLRHGDMIAADGYVEGVLDAASAALLVVEGADGAGTRVAGYCRADDRGVTVRRSPSYDATRELARVSLHRASLVALDIEPSARLLGRDVQRVLLAAEAVGAADACLAMARDYAIDRVAYGRPIGTYQAIKHKLVEMLRLTEGARSVVAAASREWQTSDFVVSANAARVVATQALDYAAPENIFIHGGVGATWEHDASLYYRRAEVSRRLGGGSRAAALVVAATLLERGVTAVKPR